MDSVASARGLMDRPSNVMLLSSPLLLLAPPRMMMSVVAPSALLIAFAVVSDDDVFMSSNDCRSLTSDLISLPPPPRAILATYVDAASLFVKSCRCSRVGSLPREL